MSRLELKRFYCKSSLLKYNSVVTNDILKAKEAFNMTFFQLCVIDEDNEDDVDEASCIDAETVKIRTRTRLGVKREDKAVPAQPLLPWQDR